MKQVLEWMLADPPWELPNYVGNFGHDLKETWAWIMTGGAVLGTMVPMTPTIPRPLGTSNSESKVSVSNGELPSPRQAMSKVWLANDVKHTLDKGVWEATPATHRGWRIFMEVSDLSDLLALH